jgi:Ca2+-dependent lipid-binding protein
MSFTNIPSGTLIVKPLMAKLARDNEIIGRMDPYIRITVCNNFQDTEICYNGHKTPSWNSKLGFRMGIHDVITFEVWNKNRIRKDSLIGTGATSTNNLLGRHEHINKWIPLSYLNGCAGELLLDLEFFPDGGFNIESIGERAESLYFSQNYLPSPRFDIPAERTIFPAVSSTLYQREPINVMSSRQDTRTMDRSLPKFNIRE